MSPFSHPAPLFSVIIPVLGEASRINGVIDNIRAAGYGTPLEIIVADGDPAGTTLRAIARDGVTGLVAAPGRGSQQNAGAAVARGEYLLFLHADARLPAGAFDEAARLLDSGADLAAFSLAIRSESLALRAVAAAANWRSRLLSLPYGDQAFCLRRDLFAALGGFAAIPVMEDVELARTLRRAGGVVAISKQRVSVSARRWRAEGVVRATLRNLALLALYSCGVSPGRLARFYPPRPDAPADLLP